MAYLKDFTSYREIEQARRRITFRSFLNQILGIRAIDFDVIHWGLRQRFDESRYVHLSTPPPATTPIAENSAGAKVAVQGKTRYNAIDSFVQPDTEDFKNRLDRSRDHRMVNFPGKKAVCVLCCKLCQNNSHDKRKYREGAQTTKFCFDCRVPICKHCFVEFHTTEQLELPNCPGKLAKEGPRKRRRSGQQDEVI